MKQLNMGVIISKLTRPLRNFNIESRVEREISKGKRKAAPHYQADMQPAVSKEIEDELSRKHERLDNHLKQIYVQSHGPQLVIEPNKNRPLPQDRSQVPLFEYGVKDPIDIPKGKTTLKMAFEFLFDHHTDGTKHSVPIIAQKYHLPENTVSNIVKTYQVFEIYLRKKDADDSGVLAGPKLKRSVIRKVKDVKQLEDPTKKDVKQLENPTKKDRSKQ